jgi:hypothetical protein
MKSTAERCAEYEKFKNIDAEKGCNQKSGMNRNGKRNSAGFGID